MENTKEEKILAGNFLPLGRSCACHGLGQMAAK
jgi:hypothetical protein